MKTEIQNILKKSPCRLKWWNIHKWQKETAFTNLLEACEHYNITIKEIGDDVLLTLSSGGLIINLASTFAECEIHIVRLIEAFNQFLGYKTVIKTRFNETKINF